MSETNTIPSTSYPDDIVPPSLEGIQKAHARIKDYVHRTPLITSKTLDDLVTNHIRSSSQSVELKDIRVQVALKCENFQRIGAFKIRGATNALLKHLETHPPSPNDTQAGSTRPALQVFTHSSGNHAQAVALACKTLSTPTRPIHANIVMPSTAAPIKRDAVLSYGARLIPCIEGSRQELCDAEMQKARERGEEVVFVHPNDAVDVIEGQGTLYLEVCDQVKELGWTKPDVVVVPVGGGGVISGVAVAAKGLSDGQVKVVGAEPLAAGDCKLVFDTKVWHPAFPPSTVCDGLLTSTGFVNMPTILRYVDQVLTAEDESIIRAMKFIWQRMKIIAEPSSCVPLATILGTALGGPPTAGEGWIPFVENLIAQRGVQDGVLRIVLVVTGGNVTFDKVLGTFASIDN